MDKPAVSLVIYRFTGRHFFFNVPKRWCEECDLMVHAVEQAIRSSPDVPGTLVVKPWFENLPAALLKGGWHPPVLLVDGRVVCQGRVPSVSFVKEAVRAAFQRLGASGSRDG